MSAVNPLVAFYDIHGRREVSNKDIIIIILVCPGHHTRLSDIIVNAIYISIYVSCGVRDKIKEYHLSLSSMDVVKGD
jgi:hypothetical protein